MKIKRILSAAGAVVILSAMLTGCCASLKTARVAGKFGSALKSQPVTSATAEINCRISVSSQSDTTESRFHTVVRSRANWDESRSYSEISSSFTSRDLQHEEQMQCYSNGESGKQVRYVHMDGLDTWVRLEDQIRLVDIDPGLILLLLDKVSKDTTLEQKESGTGGGESYLLKLTFAAEDIQQFAQTAGLNIPAEFLECDLKGVNIPLELEIEDKTFLPLSLKMELQGMNSSVVSALAKAFARGKDAEQADIEIQELSLLITNFQYETQDIPMLPKGAAENALDMKKVKEIRN